MQEYDDIVAAVVATVVATIVIVDCHVLVQHYLFADWDRGSLCHVEVR